VNHPKTKKKKTRKGYLSIYLEMVDGKQRPHDFWARVNFQVTARHKSDASLDIKKSSKVMFQIFFSFCFFFETCFCEIQQCSSHVMVTSFFPVLL
jgi:hypothetical protein